MDRIDVQYEEDGELQVGWFDRDAATAFDEDTHWDGHNNISAATGSQWDHQRLYRTGQGRWVLHCWSQWEGTVPTWHFVDEKLALNWLIQNAGIPVAEKYFGPLGDERGPAITGPRPAWVEQ